MAFILHKVSTAKWPTESEKSKNTGKYYFQVIPHKACPTCLKRKLIAQQEITPY
jgi:hypothetical protein